ncbi:MAG: hypothetical protein M9921_13600 [Fimbriimonadaceae bacterium]|nr:hypothetical protein [Fimbriimonadaceae bacterium]
MKHVVSVSLGSSKRDKVHEVEVLGHAFRIERRGTDGDLDKFAALFTELDGKVDALGIGGADLYVVVGEKRYTFRQIAKLVAGAKTTPVVDGSGLKHTLERETIRTLRREGTVAFQGLKVLLVSAVDRFGMAQALVEAGADTVFGDLMFAIGVPIRVRSYRTVKWIGALSLPLITRLPFKWFYPTGEKQDSRTPKFEWAFREAELICGDWHFIKRYAPDDLTGKTILTQTLRKADLEWLAGAGVSRVITTTPVMGGETFATNVMEGVLVAALGKRPEALSESDYLEALELLGWKPNVLELAKPEVQSGTF